MLGRIIIYNAEISRKSEVFGDVETDNDISDAPVAPLYVGDGMKRHMKLTKNAQFTVKYFFFAYTNNDTLNAN